MALQKGTKPLFAFSLSPAAQLLFLIPLMLLSPSLAESLSTGEEAASQVFHSTIILQLS